MAPAAHQRTLIGIRIPCHCPPPSCPCIGHDGLIQHDPGPRVSNVMGLAQWVMILETMAKLWRNRGPTRRRHQGIDLQGRELNRDTMIYC
jgi:hypothetical protein